LVNDSENIAALRAPADFSIDEMVTDHRAEDAEHNRGNGAYAPAEVGCRKPYSQFSPYLLANSCSATRA